MSLIKARGNPGFSIGSRFNVLISAIKNPLPALAAKISLSQYLRFRICLIHIPILGAMSDAAFHSCNALGGINCQTQFRIERIGQANCEAEICTWIFFVGNDLVSQDLEGSFGGCLCTC